MSRRDTPTAPRCSRCHVTLGEKDLALGRCAGCHLAFTPKQFDAVRVRTSSSMAHSFQVELAAMASRLEKDGRDACLELAWQLRELHATFGHWLKAPPLDDARNDGYAQALTLLREANGLLGKRAPKR